MKQAPRPAAAYWLSILLLLSLTACSGLFGGDDSSRGLNNDGDTGSCNIDIDQLEQEVRLNQRDCSVAPCPEGSYCGDGDICRVDCYADSDCGRNGTCTCDGVCVIDDTPDGPPGSDPDLSCGRDEALVASVESFQRDCSVDQDCPKGAYCDEATGACAFDCLGTNHQGRGCDAAAGEVCGCNGRCLVPGEALPGVDDKRALLEVEPSIINIASNESCAGFAVTIRSDEPIGPDTQVNLRGPLGALLSEEASDDDSTLGCAGTERELSVANWAANFEDGIYTATRNFAVRLSDAALMNLVPESSVLVGGEGGFTAEGGVATADVAVAPDGSQTADVLTALEVEAPGALLDLDFTGTTAPAGASYSRSGTIKPITGIDANGGVTVTEFGPDVFAYAYNAAFTHASKTGVLIEPEATNIVNYDSDQPTYINIDVVRDVAIAPDGGTTADRATGLAGNSRIFAPTAAAETKDNTDYVFSVFVRLADGATDPTFGLRVDGPGAGSASMTYFDATTQWQRYSITWNSGPGAVGANYNAGVWVQGVNRSVEVWGFQVEEGTTPSSYIPTAGAPATRGATDLRIANAVSSGYLDVTLGEASIRYVVRQQKSNQDNYLWDRGNAWRDRLMVRRNGVGARLYDGANSEVIRFAGLSDDIGVENSVVTRWNAAGSPALEASLNQQAFVGGGDAFTPSTDDMDIHIGKPSLAVWGIPTSMVVASFATYDAPQAAGAGSSASARTSRTFPDLVPGTYTFSVWARRVGDGSPSLRLSASGGGDVVHALTSEWARYSLSYTALAGDTLSATLEATAANESIALWGAQLEQGGLGDFVPTTGQPFNPSVSGRSNVVSYSEDLDRWTPFGVNVSKDAAESPSGARTAESLSLASPGSVGHVSIPVTLPGGGTSWTASAYVRSPSGAAQFTLLAACFVGGASETFDVTTEWQRIETTFSLTGQGGACSLLLRPETEGEFHVWGVQAELGAEATPVIRTIGVPRTIRSLAGAEGPWTIRINSAQVAGGTTVSINDDPPTPPVPRSGRYEGVLTYQGTNGAPNVRVPVRALSRDVDDHLFLIDDNRTLTADGGVLVSTGAPVVDVPWLFDADDQVVMAASLAATLPQYVFEDADGAFEGDLVDGEVILTLQGNEARVATLQLSRVGDLDASASCADPCAAGSSCIASVDLCVPDDVVPTSFDASDVDDFEHKPLRDIAGQATWLASPRSSEGTIILQDHVWMEKLLCMDPSEDDTRFSSRPFVLSDSLPNVLKDAVFGPSQRSNSYSYSFLPRSGDLMCADPNRYPKAFPIFTARDRAMASQSADLQASELLRACLGELLQRPTYPSPTAEEEERMRRYFGPKASCVSLARFYPAIWVGLFSEGLDSESRWPAQRSPRAGELAQRLLQKWLSTLSFIALQGREELELDDALGVAAGVTPVSIDSVLGAVGLGLELFLDNDVIETLELLAPARLRSGDYRFLPAAVSRYPINVDDGFDDIDGGVLLDVIGGRGLRVINQEIPQIPGLPSMPTIMGPDAGGIVSLGTRGRFAEPALDPSGDVTFSFWHGFRGGTGSGTVLRLNGQAEPFFEVWLERNSALDQTLVRVAQMSVPPELGLEWEPTPPNLPNPQPRREPCSITPSPCLNGQCQSGYQCVDSVCVPDGATQNPDGEWTCEVEEQSFGPWQPQIANNVREELLFDVTDFLPAATELPETALHHIAVTRNAANHSVSIWIDGIPVELDPAKVTRTVGDEVIAPAGQGRTWSFRSPPRLYAERAHLEIDYAGTVMGDLIVFGDVLTDEYVEQIHGDGIGAPRPEGTALPADAPRSRDFEAGLPVHLVETASQYLRSTEVFANQRRAVVLNNCDDAGESAARTEVLNFVGDALRRATAVEAMAKRLVPRASVVRECYDARDCTGLSAQPTVCLGGSFTEESIVLGVCATSEGVLTEEPAWTADFDNALVELAATREALIDATEEIRECKPKLVSAALPLFFGDVAGTNSRYFASSDYLLSIWAKPAINAAVGALEQARTAWLNKRNSEIQELAADYEMDRRVEQIASGPGAEVISLCGLVGVDPATVLEEFGPDGLTPETCFVADSQFCTGSSATAACLRGQIGGAYLAFFAAEQRRKQALQERTAAKAEWVAQGDYCREVEKTNNDISTAQKDYAEAQKAVGWMDKALSVAEIGVSLYTNPLKGLSDMQKMATYLNGAAQGFGVLARGLEEEADRTGPELEEYVTRLRGELEEKGCRKEEARLLGRLQPLATNFYAALLDQRRALQQAEELQRRVSQLVYQVGPAVEREKSRRLPSVAHHYWLDERIDRYKADFEWAKRLTYLASVAVEYEFQQSLDIGGRILEAKNANNLLDALRLLEQEQAGRTINNRRPEEGTLVVSMRDQLLELEDQSLQVEQIAGESYDTASKRFGDLLSAPTSAVYDLEGRYLGQGIRFPVTELGALEYRCGERMWRVTATIQGDFANVEEPSAPLLLLKNNTFRSRYCHGLGDGEEWQEGSVSNEARLFHPSDRSERVVSEENYTSALMQPWFNVRRTDFYKVQYQEGSSEELAGRGLYGDYILVLPDKGLLNWSDCRPAPGAADSAGCDSFPVDKIEDILIRFDYLSVDNVRAGLTSDDENASLVDEADGASEAADPMGQAQADETWFMSR